MRDFFEIFIPVIAFMVAIIVIIGSIAVIIDKEVCNNISEVYKVDTKYYVFGGCFVKTDTEYVSLKSYENVHKNGYNLNINERKDNDTKNI